MPGKGWKGKESRSKILAIAAREFAEHGYNDTKISTIVSKAGLTQPSFYLYFSNKETVFEELVNEFRVRLRHLTKSLRMATGVEQEQLPQRLIESLEKIFVFLAEDPDITCIGLFLAPDAEEIKAELTQTVVDNLRAEQATGYFRSDLSMSMAAECIVGVVLHFTKSYLLRGLGEPANLAKEIGGFLMNGMLRQN